MPFVTVPGGVRLWYEELGAGEPLLLVMGQGSDHHGWDGVRDDFAAQHRVIVFDHRGTGASDKPREPAYSIELFAADAVALLNHLGIERAHVYGISMGGRIAQRLAISHASRVGAVVLGCTTPGNRMGVKRPPDVDRMMSTRADDPEAALQLLLEQMVSPEYAAAHPEYVERYRERALNPIPPFAQRMHYLASEGHDAWDELPGITAPVLVIHGDSDQVNMSANAGLLAGRIPGAELKMIAGGRHGFFVEFREQASAAVLDFLRRHPLDEL
ncbi:MAG: alpha/beta fold hydrolase [Dehalococcoidia bacterium]|nr:alpha/beta fold hydrolase [Dehalococcoidia bacterium]